MPSYFILVPILLPVIVGILLLIFPIEDAKKRNICIEIVVVLNTILVLWLLTHRPTESFYMFSLGARLPLTLNIDGLSMFFGGLVACPVIGVPTSVGYGANFGGLAALLSMLNSCASGVSVVNIDNGFGAGVLASKINKQAIKK